MKTTDNPLVAGILTRISQGLAGVNEAKQLTEIFDAIDARIDALTFTKNNHTNHETY